MPLVRYVRRAMNAAIRFVIVLVVCSVPFSWAQPDELALLSASVRTQKQVYKPNESIFVEYHEFPGNRTDWITIVPAGASDRTYREWHYTQGRRSGVLAFKGLPAGNYEARAYFNWGREGYTVRSRHSFQVGGSTGFKCRWDKIAGPGGPWTTGWQPNHTAAACGHGACYSCPSESRCGLYPTGSVISHSPYGGQGNCQVMWRLRCTCIAL